MDVVYALPELQRRFMAALYGDGGAGLEAALVGHGLDPAARLRVYRRSCSAIQTYALRTAFPGVLALVGDDYFDQVSRAYRLAHPSRSGNLQDFGARFAAYLETLAELGARAYLPDVARLEWLRQESALAAEVPVPARDGCAAFAGTDRIELHPGVRLFSSRHPVLTIWRYAIAPTPGHLVLDGHGENVVLWREDGEVAMAALDAASFACIAAIACGGTWGSACAAARARDAPFDPAAVVDSLFRCGLIAGVTSSASTIKESCPCS